MRKFVQLFFLLVLTSRTGLIAQVTTSPSDTLRTIQIIRGNTLREKTIDSVTRIETIAGDVEIHEGTTKFNCDSAIINRRLNTVEAFGNVRINQGDSLFTSSQYLKYLGNERTAYLKRNVRLTDKKATLTTQDLEYNLTTGIGKYYNGGKVVNGKTVLTSREGTYYEDTKDVYFVNNVDVTDPKTKIKADSLLYNTQNQKLNFIGPTFIKNKDGDIFTTQGTYDLSNGNAFFGNRTSVKDSSGRFYQANNMAFEEKSGQAQLEGNAIIRDSANRFIVTGNELFLSRKNNSFLATKKPVLVVWQDKDTTYISGDTLFSGFTQQVYPNELVSRKDSASVTDSVKNVVKNSGNIIVQKDSAKSIQKSAAIITRDSLQTIPKDSVQATLIRPKESQAIKDTVKRFTPDSLNIKDSALKKDSIRYFLAYHHVKIFNDSLQAVCDSLFYSGADSVFRMFYEPVIWSGKSQVTGDTIFLYTKNKKAERIYVFENGIMINRINSEFYNQVAGRTINGYFKDGAIDYMRIKGSPAESIYYVQDKDSAFTGMNRADGSVIDMYFVKEQLDKVKFVNDVHGKLYPIRQIPKDQKFLKRFAWIEKRRPKNKLELFE